MNIDSASKQSTSTAEIKQGDKVDEKLPIGQLFTLGLQHVLVMYAGAVAVPLVIGESLGLSKADVAYLISSDLFCCGIVTLLQCIGIGRFAGIRLPVIMSVTFTAVTPMIAIGGNPELGLVGIFCTTIASGLICTLMVPLIGKLIPLFPTVVTGIVITSIGLSIMGVGINWAAGGRGNAEFGNPLFIAIATAVLVFILLLTRYAKGFIANISVLLGIVFGFALALVLGRVNFDGLSNAAWFSPVIPFHFFTEVPKASTLIAMIIPTLTMTLVCIITFIESMGMFFALGDIVGRPATKQDIIRGMRVDAIGTVIGGVFNSFPHTSFSQNIGLVSVTGISSRWVCVMAGAILLTFGLVPKMSILVASIPQFVLGGAGLVMFGMVLATGIKILAQVDYAKNKYNLYIVAISLGIGMTPLVAPGFFKQLPNALQPLLHSGILLSTTAAVILNYFFNGYQGEEKKEAELPTETQPVEA